MTDFSQGELRRQAFTNAVQLLQQNVIDFSVEDAIVVADWLLTGEANIGLKFSKQYTENYERSKEGTDGTGR